MAQNPELGELKPEHGVTTRTWNHPKHRQMVPSSHVYYRSLSSIPHRAVCCQVRKPWLLQETLGGSQQGGFQKGDFGRCSPVPKTGTRVHSDVPRYQKPGWGYMRMFPYTKTWNEGTFAKTTLLRNHPFVPLGTMPRDGARFYGEWSLLSSCILWMPNTLSRISLSSAWDLQTSSWDQKFHLFMCPKPTCRFLSERSCAAVPFSIRNGVSEELGRSWHWPGLPMTNLRGGLAQACSMYCNSRTLSR